VIVLVTKQPDGMVYVTVAIPADSPVRLPAEEMIATDEGLQLHTPGPLPAGGVHDSTVDEEMQTAAAPVIAPGLAVTVTVWFTKHPVGMV